MITTSKKRNTIARIIKEKHDSQNHDNQNQKEKHDSYNPNR